jgi:hypothetical protein
LDGSGNQQWKSKRKVEKLFAVYPGSIRNSSQEESIIGTKTGEYYQSQRACNSQKIFTGREIRSAHRKMEKERKNVQTGNGQ